MLDLTQTSDKICQTTAELGLLSSEACAIMASSKESTESDEVSE